MAALRRPRAVGRPSFYFACSCNVEVPSELEDNAFHCGHGGELGDLYPRRGGARFCSNTLTIWWFRPEEFAPVTISGYEISDNHGRKFWVSRQHAESLAALLACQQRLPPCPRSTGKKNSDEANGGKCSTQAVQASDYSNEFVACAFMMPVEPKTWYSVKVCATSAHPLVPLGEQSKPLHWQSPGIDMSKIRVTGATFDAASGSSFTVTFVPPSCFGTAPCSATPVGYTVHWELISDSRDASVTKDRGYASHYVDIMEAHRLEPSKAGDLSRLSPQNKASPPLHSDRDYASQQSQNETHKGASRVQKLPRAAQVDISYSWSTTGANGSSGVIEVAPHTIIAIITCPPPGRENDLKLRLLDGARYCIWVSAPFGTSV